MNCTCSDYLLVEFRSRMAFASRLWKMWWCCLWRCSRRSSKCHSWLQRSWVDFVCAVTFKLNSIGECYCHKCLQNTQTCHTWLSTTCLMFSMWHNYLLEKGRTVLCHILKGENVGLRCLLLPSFNRRTRCSIVWLQVVFNFGWLH